MVGERSYLHRHRLATGRRLRRHGVGDVVGAVLAVVSLGAGLLMGCASPASPGIAEAITASPSATPDPIDQCAAQLEYWINEALSGAPDRGYDYQEMGLSGAKYEALNAILDRADAAPKTDPEAATWAHEQARGACVEVAARPTSTVSRGGWP